MKYTKIIKIFFFILALCPVPSFAFEQTRSSRETVQTAAPGVEARRVEITNLPSAAQAPQTYTPINNAVRDIPATTSMATNSTTTILKLYKITPIKKIKVSKLKHSDFKVLKNLDKNKSSKFKIKLLDFVKVYQANLDQRLKNLEKIKAALKNVNQGIVEVSQSGDLLIKSEALIKSKQIELENIIVKIDKLGAESNMAQMQKTVIEIKAVFADINKTNDDLDSILEKLVALLGSVGIKVEIVKAPVDSAEYK